jgi:hypothetical protein
MLHTARQPAASHSHTCFLQPAAHLHSTREPAGIERERESSKTAEIRARSIVKIDFVIKEKHEQTTHKNLAFLFLINFKIVFSLIWLTSSTRRYLIAAKKQDNI